ncbi:MAG: hypothetical protein H6579_09915 [Chitinophagales bacterium]|nr:hypothetical protein [Chitinophagales bacterium]
MKKINLFILIFSSILLFSCNNSNPESPEQMEEETQSTEENVEVEAAVEGSTTEIPAFENQDLASFAVAFDDYFNRSMELLQQGDMEKLKSLEAEGMELQKKAETLKSMISENDKALLEEYLKEKGKEMLSASGLDKLGEKMNEASTK